MTDLRTALRRLNDAAHEALAAALEHPDSYERGVVWDRLHAIVDDTDRMVCETAPKIDPLPAPTLPLAVQEMMALCCRDVAQMTGVSEIAWPDRFDTMDRMRAADAEYRKQGTTLFRAEYMQQPILYDEVAPNVEGKP